MKIVPPILCATASLLATAAAAQSVSAKLPIYKDPEAPIEKRIDDLLKRMTLQEKLNQLRCDRDAWEKFVSTTGYGQTLDILRPMKSLPSAQRANEVQRIALKSRLGIPIVIHDEALHGLIGDGTTSFPQSIAMAATWDPTVTGRVAAAIAEESRARGVRHVLAPVINVIRDARWGRVEETYGEDPVLTSRMAVAYVKEFENRGVATNPKHYIVNTGDGGHDSYAIDISERQLREIYLPPFEAAIKEGGASSVMSSYNSYDGIAVSANRFLLTDILRGEWGFKGLVASDYGATEGILYNHHNVANEKEAAAAGLNAGLDCEWPNVRIWGKGLDDAVKEGLISKRTLDQAVRRVLWVKFKTGMFEDPWANPDHVLEIVQSPAHRQAALDAAREAMTLLKNDSGALPLKKTLKSIAVIGPYAKDGIPLGGYSGSNVPMVSVVDGIKAKVGPDTKVEWAPGASFTTERTFPPISGATFRNLKGEYFDNDKLQGAPKVTRNDLQLAFDWGNGSPDPALPNDHFSARWMGQIVPEKSGDYTIALTGDDGVRLWIDGKLLVDDWSEHAPHTTQAPLHVEAGVPLAIKLEYFESSGQASVQLGWGLSSAGRPEIDDAVELAKRSDVAVVVAGIIEGEGQDRAFLDLPGTQEEEIRRIAATGTPVVVVLTAGSPVTMGNWIDRVPAILDAWYPGQEGGTAIADVLFGDVNPGGKLPITFPRSVGQCPIYYELPPTGRGYDYVDLTGRPQFPFGFGLSYTTFAYSNLKIAAPQEKGKDVTVTFDVENNGPVAGDEVPQLYIHQSVSSIVRPLKSLKDFTRIHLNAGEKRTVTFTLKPDSRMIWNVKMKKVIEPGQMEVMIGSSSEDIRLRGTYQEK